jgi:hypothetical protein
VTLRANILSFVPAFAAGFVLVLAALATPRAAAYHTNFQGSCNDSYQFTTARTRNQSRAYAYIGAREGYQWAGGCWNDNNRDDSPGDPTRDPNTRGEGGDCSGFTWKSWYERMSESDGGWTYHYRMRNQHGPYDTTKFKAGTGAPNTTVTKSAAIKMDAFVSSHHIGMIYQARTTPGTDRIVEAKQESTGTGIWSRNYRGDSSYSGARRVGWATS